MLNILLLLFVRTLYAAQAHADDIMLLMMIMTMMTTTMSTMPQGGGQRLRIDQRLQRRR